MSALPPREEPPELRAARIEYENAQRAIEEYGDGPISKITVARSRELATRLENAHAAYARARLEARKLGKL